MPLNVAGKRGSGCQRRQLAPTYLSALLETKSFQHGGKFWMFLSTGQHAVLCRRCKMGETQACPQRGRWQPFPWGRRPPCEPQLSVPRSSALDKPLTLLSFH